MATKKKVKATKRAKAPAKKGPKKRSPRPCVPPEICKYLKELKVWLLWLEQDYTDLRIAMCNVEQQAFTGTGDPTKRFPPCGGGPSGDPVKPPKVPVWD